MLARFSRPELRGRQAASQAGASSRRSPISSKALPVVNSQTLRVGAAALSVACLLGAVAAAAAAVAGVGVGVGASAALAHSSLQQQAATLATVSQESGSGLPWTGSEATCSCLMLDTSCNQKHTYHMWHSVRQ